MDKYPSPFQSSDHSIENFYGPTGVQGGRSGPIMVIQNLCSFLVLEQGELQLESDEEGQLAGEGLAIRGISIPIVYTAILTTYPTTFFKMVRGQSGSVN